MNTTQRPDQPRRYGTILRVTVNTLIITLATMLQAQDPASNAAKPSADASGPKTTPLTGGSGATNSIAKWTDSSGTLGNSIMFDNDAKVGIGTTAPANVLHVFAAANTDGIAVDGTTNPAINLRNAGVVKGYLGLATNAGAFFSGTSANDLIVRSEQGGRIVMGVGSGPSTMTVAANGNVGIGTTTPDRNLQVIALSSGFGIEVANQSGNGRKEVELTVDANAAYLDAYNWGAPSPHPLDLQPNGGFVGIRTAAPREALDISGNMRVAQMPANDTTQSATYIELSNRGVGGAPYPWRMYTASSSGAPGVDPNSLTTYEYPASGSPGCCLLRFRILHAGPTVPALLTLDGSGRLGIGAPTPREALDVTGNIVASGNISADGVITAKFQDVAEWVPASEPMVPGTVVILNPTKSNEIMPSQSAYDTTVAGVVSLQPGLVLGEASSSKAKIATTGRVRVKVDARQNPVRVGDLLVTSDRRGMAMRSEPTVINGRKFHQPGTLIGKALEPLAGVEGEILVLLSLQ